MHWIVANHKIQGTVFVLVAGKTCQPTDATTYQSSFRLAFTLLGRYEASLWRHFARTLATLEVIQGRPHLRGAP